MQILVNRTTAHVNTGTVRDGADDYTMNRCGAVTKGNLARTGGDYDAKDVLAAAAKVRAKVCKNCAKAVADELAKEEAYQARLAASLMPATEAHDLGYVDPTAPAHVSTVVLPVGVTMDADTRILSGKVGPMLALMNDGLAVLTEDGDLVLI
jgi:hypothetical protein